MRAFFIYWNVSVFFRASSSERRPEQARSHMGLGPTENLVVQPDQLWERACSR
ncbi:hypothetical protein OKW11_001341 [Pseudomonas baetica]|nr:hypothetical protein [Pseudomonas baetica]